MSAKRAGEEMAGDGANADDERPSKRPAAQPNDGGGCSVFLWGGASSGSSGNGGGSSGNQKPVLAEGLSKYKVKQMERGRRMALVLSEDGQLYGYGINGNENYEWRSDEHNSRSISCHFTTAFAKPVLAIACGSRHFAAVTEDGFYTWGQGQRGKLGHGDSRPIDSPKRVEAECLTNVTPKAVACGDDFTIFLSQEGRVYSCGYNDEGKCGIGADENTIQYRPRRLEHLENHRVTKIVCGLQHTCVLTELGAVWSFGCGDRGALGNSSHRNEYVPRLITGLEGHTIADICCGENHTLALNNHGKVLSWGDNNYGQLGRESRNDNSLPMLVNKLKDVVVAQIAAGNNHSVVLSRDTNHILTFGSNREGSLGRKPRAGYSSMNPGKVEKLKNRKVVRIGAFQSQTLAFVDSSSLTPEDRSIYTSLYSMVNDDEFSDVTFLVEGQPVHAHKAILAKRSSVFHSMFRSGMREATQREIPIPNVRRKIFLLLVEFLYTDTISIDIDDLSAVIELYQIADLYRLEELQELCCTSVQSKLTHENCGPLLQMAAESDCGALKETCMVYFVENLSKVTKSQSIEKIVSPSLLREILRKVANDSSNEDDDDASY